MIRRSAVPGALALLGLALLTPPAKADLADNLGAMTAENSQKYLQPLPKALSGTLSTGLFETGRIPKKGLTFSLGVHVMGVDLSNADKTYRPTPPPGFTPTADVDAPTVIGSTSAVAQPGQGGTTMYYPGGFDISEFAVGVPQLTIGSVFGTQAIVRWVVVDVGSSDFEKLNFFGFGGQHSISQYLPGLPVDIAAGYFYQKFKLGDGLIDSKLSQVNVTASKRFGMLEPYVGLGYDSFEMSAAYTSTSTPGDNISVAFDTETNPHFTVGLSAMLGFVRLGAEFNSAAETGAALALSFGRF